MSNSVPKNGMTPLVLISIFLSLTEVVLGVSVTYTIGGVQIALVSFAILFPLLIAAAFFSILWLKPYVFYSPFEYSSADEAETFINAISQDAKRIKNTATEVANIARDVEKLREELAIDVVSLKKEVDEARVLAIAGL